MLPVKHHMGQRRRIDRFCLIATRQQIQHDATLISCVHHHVHLQPGRWRNPLLLDRLHQLLPRPHPKRQRRLQLMLQRDRPPIVINLHPNLDKN